ncbi:hypothetical protein [Flavobacterium psychraquaticum]|uniref:hypothetical protein n=1 Tax=Flavobacterium psychraquaticum TaxID=3103958 RepID=UPI002ACE96BC|nr:hypothetical protein [Flavobacterium sp. LB-N7T]
MILSQNRKANHSHGKAPNEVSSDFFIRTTTIKDVNSFLKEKISANRLQGRNKNYSLSDFSIDTTFINQCILNNGELSFFF